MTSKPSENNVADAQETTASGSAACLCAISEHNPPTCTVYKKSVRVNWPSSVQSNSGAGGNNVLRGTVRDMSPKSARRLAFILANAPLPFRVMATLTFRTQPEQPKAIFKRWVRTMRDQCLWSGQVAWVMEFQARGVVHFHVVFSGDAWWDEHYLSCRDLSYVTRKGKGVSIVRGWLERKIVTAWIDAVGDESDEFFRFQWGGVVELLKEPDSVSRYFSNYLSKREQKELPVEMAGQGRWWWCSAECMPLPESTAILKRWPFDKQLGVVFDKRDLDGCMAPKPGKEPGVTFVRKGDGSMLSVMRSYFQPDLKEQDQRAYQRPDNGFLAAAEIRACLPSKDCESPDWCTSGGMCPACYAATAGRRYGSIEKGWE